MSYFNDINPIFINYGGYSRTPFNSSLDNALNSVLNNQVSVPQDVNYLPSVLASLHSAPSPAMPQSASFIDLLQSIHSSSPTGNVFDIMGQITPNTGVNSTNSTSNPAEIPSFVSPNNRQKLAELNSQMRERVIELMKRYYNKTGKTFEISEAYRSKKVEDERRAAAKLRNDGSERFYAKGISQHTLGNGIDISRRTTSREQLAIIQHIWKHEMGLTIGMDYHDDNGKHLDEDWMCDGRPDISRQSKAAPWTSKNGSTIASNNNNYSNRFGWLNTSFGGFGGGYGGFSSGMGYGGFGSGFGGGFGGFGGGFGSYGGGFNAMLMRLLGGLNSNTNNVPSGNNFERVLSYIYKREGGYANDPDDRGGKTNYGITHSTYDSWRKKQGLPVRDVTLITKEEVRTIYYNEYWLKSGASQIADFNRARALFDASVNMGVGTAKKLYAQSGGDLNKFAALRKQRYDAIAVKRPSQLKYLTRWKERADISAGLKRT